MANFNNLILDTDLSVSYTLKRSAIKSITIDLETDVMTVNWSKKTAGDVEKGDGFTTLTAVDLTPGIISGLSMLNDLLLPIISTKESFPSNTIGP